MKRWLAHIAICLLLGAITTIAGAWVLAGFMPIDGGNPMFVPKRKEIAAWNANPPANVDSTPLMVSRSASPGVVVVQISGGRSNSDIAVTKVGKDGEVWGMRITSSGSSTIWDHVIIVQSGWPIAAFEGRRWDIGQPFTSALAVSDAMRRTPTHNTTIFHQTISIARTASGSREYRLLPWRPMWPGFAINTLFYAAILWLLFPGSLALRRFIRRKRRLCAACGYDLRGADHERCPECGTVVKAFRHRVEPDSPVGTSR